MDWHPCNACVLLAWTGTHATPVCCCTQCTLQGTQCTLRGTQCSVRYPVCAMRYPTLRPGKLPRDIGPDCIECAVCLLTGGDRTAPSPSPHKGNGFSSDRTSVLPSNCHGNEGRYQFLSCFLCLLDSVHFNNRACVLTSQYGVVSDGLGI